MCLCCQQEKPKVLSLTGPTTNVKGTVCLNGPAEYSCQSIDVKISSLATCVSGGTCRVFTTSSPYDGNLGGISGANANCQLKADSASLGGIWNAFLADGTFPPAHINYDATVTYVLAVSRKVVATPGSLSSSSNLSNAIHENELGSTSGGAVWTGYTNTGTDSSNNCNGWTSNDGALYTGEVGSTISSVAPNWFSYANLGCGKQMGLYCFESP